jgi:Na+/melibiose symporter-like transporter
VIITCKKQVPFRWIAFAILPWASFTFNGYVVGVAFLFSLKKFVENPAGLTFILSLPGFVSIVLQPVVSFLSDRIWTRYGRRKPFVVTSLTGITICLLLLPLMPNFWTLLAVFMCLNIFTDLNSAMEPLKLEIIPPQERGRATGAMTWCSNLACMLFYFVALGRFDDVRYMGGFQLFGETAIYWSAGMLMGAMALLITLGIREIDQKSPLRGQRLTIRNFFGGLLDQELWPVYMLVVGSACLNYYAGLGPLSNLLYTDQWGYTKQEMGINIAVGGIINMFVIGVLTVFADRLNRMRAYQTLICMSLAGNVLYYCYIEFVLPDKHPSLIEIIVFGETLSILAILTGLVYIPLVYDYIRRNKMGTYNAGAALVTKLTILITLNGVGLFVWGYAKLLQPAAGEMTRVVLRDDHLQKAEIRAQLRAAAWTCPADNAPAASSNVDAIAWQSTGTVANDGRCWEIRLRDKDSEKLAGDRENLDKQSAPLIAEEKMLRDSAAMLKQRGKAEAALREEDKADRKKIPIDELNARLKAIDATLAARAENFHAQVARFFGDRLLTEGEQVIGARVSHALVVELATTNRPDAHLVEKTLHDLRAQDESIIDLRPLELANGYGLAVSALLDVGADEASAAHEIESEVEGVASRREPGLFTTGAEPLGSSDQTAVTLDLELVEEPLDTYVSPITRVVNVVLALFDRVPSPDRRLSAMARDLRGLGETNHVRVTPGPAPKTLSVTAVLPTTATKAASVDDPVGRRLQALLGGTSQGDTVGQARAFYDRIESAAAAQRLTVAHPTLVSAYAPMKYDYMSGYLWMFMMSLVGIGITIAFVRFEAKGFVRKHGIEEALES